MQIDYRNDVRSTLPPEIGLCLFRVLQEALHNAAKHSGEKRFEVQLHEESDEVHLIIVDLARGSTSMQQGKVEAWVSRACRSEFGWRMGL